MFKNLLILSAGFILYSMCVYGSCFISGNGSEVKAGVSSVGHKIYVDIPEVKDLPVEQEPKLLEDTEQYSEIPQPQTEQVQTYEYTKYTRYRKRSCVRRLLGRR
jgi:hypothetical protein